VPEFEHPAALCVDQLDVKIEKKVDVVPSGLKMGLVPPKWFIIKFICQNDRYDQPMVKIELLCVRDVYIQSVKLAIGIYDCSK